MSILELTTTDTRGLFLDVGCNFGSEASIQAIAGPAFEALSHGNPPLIALNLHATDMVDDAAFAFLEELAWRGFQTGTRVVVTEAPLEVRRAMVIEGLADSCTLMFDGRASARVLPARLTTGRS